MLRSAGWGAIAALGIGVIVGFWAAVVNAPPEVTGGIASGLGAAFGLLAFGGSMALRTFNRPRFNPARSSRAYARATAPIRS